MARLSPLLRRFRSYVEKHERVRWYCYAGTKDAEVLLVKDKVTEVRYLLKVWETELSVGPARIKKAITRYSKFHNQHVDRFALLGHRFRLSAFAFAQSPRYRREIGLYNFELHSDRVLHSFNNRDPLFSLFAHFLRGEGYVTQPSVSKEVKGARFAKVYVDSDVLIAYLKGALPVVRLFGRARKERIQLVTSTMVVQDLMLISKKTRKPTPLQIQALLGDKRLAVVDSPRLSGVSQYVDRASDVFRQLHPNDIVSLLSARETGCTYFVTQDADLLSQRHIAGLRILTPQEMAEQLGS